MFRLSSTSPFSISPISSDSFRDRFSRLTWVFTGALFMLRAGRCVATHATMTHPANMRPSHVMQFKKLKIFIIIYEGNGVSCKWCSRDVNDATCNWKESPPLQQSPTASSTWWWIVTMQQGPRAFRNSSNPVFGGEEIDVIVCEWTRRWNRRVDIPSDISVAKLHSRNKLRSLWNSAAWLMLPACSARRMTHFAEKAPSRKKSR